jgi:hypothetical protein
MHSRYALARYALCFAVLSALGCKSVPLTPRDVLDPNTGSTVTVAEEPLLFVRIRGQAPALTHDFVRLVAAETYRAGQYADLMLLYRWSLAEQGGPLPKDDGGRLLIVADDQMIELLPLAQVPAGLSQLDGLLAPGNVAVVSYAYPVNTTDLRLIAESRSLTAQLMQESPNTPYTLWRDGRPALSQFIKESIEH